MKPCLTFDEALSNFQKFLEAQGWPRRVTWLRPEDARLLKGRIAIRRVSAKYGESHARRVYSNGTVGRLGVGLEAVCRVEEETFARVIRPLHKDASERGLFPEVPKLSVPHHPPVVALTPFWMWPLLATEPVWPSADPDIEA